MRPENKEALSAEIARAHSFAENGKMSLAVRSFDLAREMLVVWAKPASLQKQIAREKAHLVKERNRLRKINFDHGAGDGRTPLLILGDSLGLPRTDQKLIGYRGARHTYAWMLGSEKHGFQPTSVCQRYFTTQDALDVLEEEPDLTQSDAALIHLGLNDCAKRMFLEDERLALALLSADTRTALLSFAKRYRHAILTLLPGRHYTSLEDFQHNLDLLINRLQRGGCKKIVLTTIILPPSRTWRATPGVNENFGRYNLVLMSAAARNGAILFDFNRLVAERGLAEMLGEDGMHLSEAGHAMFANEASALLK